MVTYESVLDQIAAIPPAVSGQLRDICWLTPARVVGVARDQFGHLELFLAGLRLHPRSKTVGDSLEFHAWHRSNGVPLDANRLLLPALGHFDQVGAFIAIELLRNGADRRLENAFVVTEPIIELAIRRLLMSEAAVLGMAGELLLLDALCRWAPAALVSQVVDCWEGWRHAVRDFTWDGVGVEVKITRRATSTHMIENIHQVDPLVGGDDGAREDRLLLISIGLQEAIPSENTFSIPTLVDRIVDCLRSTGNDGLISSFLTHVAAYGTDSGLGYEHASMAAEPPFIDHFAVVFFGAYYMEATAIKVRRNGDAGTHCHVAPTARWFTISLPNSLNYQNPIHGMNRVAQHILRGANR